jgi:hypothetical protein
MADKKISQLPLIQTISGSTVVVPIVHDGTTIQMSVERLSLFTSQFSATTGSNTFIGSQTITGNTSIGGNLVVAGKLTAQEFHTEVTSASILFESGSSQFGNSGDDTHIFTGSIILNGTAIGIGQLNEQTASQAVVNSVLSYVTGSINAQTASQDLVNIRISSTTGSINTTTSSFDSVFLQISSTTGSMNTQSSSQDLVNRQISSTTGSINTTTSSFDSVFLRISSTTGSINTTTSSFDSTFLRISSVTGSMNTQSSSQDLVNRGISSVTGSINTTTSSFDSVFLRIASTTGSINTTTSSFNSEFVKIGSTTSSIHFTTQSLNTQTGSQGNLNAQIGIATGSLNAFTGSVIGQTNTISTFTASINFTTQSLNRQTGSQDLVNLRISSTTGSINTTTSSFDSVFLRISSVTGSMNIQSSSQDLVNYQNSIITSSYRIELNSIEAYTSSLKSAITVNGSNVQIIGELNVNKLNVQYISSSVLLTSGSNVFGDTITDKHEFTGSVNIKDTLFIDGQAIGLTQLNAFTGSQIGKDLTLSIVTSSIDAHILKQATQTGSQDLVNYNISVYTGSQNVINTSVNSHILVQSTQTGSQDLVNLGISTFTGSLRSEVNLIEAYTASLKAAAIVSSSTQIQNYFLFAVTSSANTFYGDQTISGSLRVNGPIRGNIISGGLSVNGGITGSFAGNLAGVADYAATVAVSSVGTTTDTSLFPTFTTSPVLASYASIYSHSSSSFFLNGVTRRVHMEGFVVSGSNNIAEISGSLNVTGSIFISGSVYANTTSQSVASNTASLDFTAANFFMVQLGSNVTTHISASNLRAGQSVNVLITTGTNSTASFSTNVRQPSGSFYLPTSGSGKKDILSFVSFDSSNLYLVAVNQMI